MPRSPIRLLPALALAALATAAPTSAHALELAVQDDPVLLHRSYGDTSLAFNRTAAMGAKRIRVNLAWANQMPHAQAAARTRPARIDWNFSELERLYADAAARGLKLQVSLTGPAPAWATSSRKIGYTRPDARRFGEFATAVATAFSRPSTRIDRWSIWNEPNWHRLLAPHRTAASRYRALYRAGANAIKAVDRTNSVLIGELMPGANRRRSTTMLSFLRAVTCTKRDWTAARRCSPLRADGFAIHPYNFTRRPSRTKPTNRDIVEIASLSRLTSALDRLARRRALRTYSGNKMPLYITEYGYYTAGWAKVSKQRQADWLRESWNIAKRNRRVRQFLQYGLIDPWPAHVTWRTAVLAKDGTPRPAYSMLARLARAR